MDWSCDGQKLASGSYDRTVCVFTLDKDRLVCGLCIYCIVNVSVLPVTMLCCNIGASVITMSFSVLLCHNVYYNVLLCITVCYSVTVCHGVIVFVTVYYSVMMCVIVL